MDLVAFLFRIRKTPPSPNLSTQMAVQHLQLYAVHFLPQLPDLLLPIYPTIQRYKCVGSDAEKSLSKPQTSGTKKSKQS